MADKGPTRGGSLAVSVAAHAVAAGIATGLVLWGRPEFALAWWAASRLAYVAFAGLSLRAQDASRWYTRRWGLRGGFLRFRTGVAALMNNDALAMAAAIWLTRGTFLTHLPPAVPWVLGGALVVLGVGMKSWAAATLGPGAYYWESFFIPPEAREFKVTGPYRWFRNPMYTVGYAHAYGLALLLQSLPGLFVAAGAQGLMLVLNHWAEQPHTDRMEAGNGSVARGLPSRPAGAPAPGRGPEAAKAE